MGYWSFYFFAKLFLYAGGYIGFHFWPNLGFAAFTALPARTRYWRIAKQLVALPLGAALLYYDSWLPPLARVLSQAGSLADFTLPYLVELAGRFLNLKVLATLAVLLGVYLVLRQRLRMSAFAFVAIFAAVAIPALQSWFSDGTAVTAAENQTATPAAALAAAPAATTADALNAALSSFYGNEATRRVEFKRIASDAPPYDIIFLHICSLAWDDISYVGLENSALLKRFDYLLTGFNSAASYSGPAAIRLLRGNCGETRHSELYKPAAPGCYLFDGLQQAGFEPHWLMNHDGHFGNFFSDVRDRGGLTIPLENDTAVDVSQHAFDGSPVYSDYAVLSRWWEKRQRMPAQHVVLYYNTISLHDGNHLVGKPSMSARDNYRLRLELFMSDIGRFLDQIKSSGRRVVVVMVPEHGAAARGDRMQIPGLREIPTEAITRVPLGVALIDGSADTKTPAPQQQTSDAPTSYLAMSELLARLTSGDPFAQSAPVTLADLPETAMVSENEGTVIMQAGSTFMMRTPDGAWSPYTGRDQ